MQVGGLEGSGLVVVDMVGSHGLIESMTGSVAVALGQGRAAAREAPRACHLLPRDGHSGCAVPSRALTMPTRARAIERDDCA